MTYHDPTVPPWDPRPQKESLPPPPPGSGWYGPPPEAPYGWSPPPKQRSRAPLFIGLAVVVIVVLLLIGIVAFMGSGLGDLIGRTALQDLAVGQCFNGGRAASPTGASVVFGVEVVPCTEPHEGELAATFGYPGASTSVSYPGTDSVGTYAQDECITEFETYVGTDFNSSALEMTFVYPLESNWSLGDYSIQCIVHPPARPGADERVVPRLAPLETRGARACP